MPHTGRYGNMDYQQWTKGSFLLGVGLFLIGIGGEYLLTLSRSDVAGWVHVLLIDLGIVGVLTAVLLPIIFGIIMPLTE